jgi:hypothetical protein
MYIINRIERHILAHCFQHIATLVGKAEGWMEKRWKIHIEAGYYFVGEKNRYRTYNNNNDNNNRHFFVCLIKHLALNEQRRMQVYLQ